MKVDLIPYTPRTHQSFWCNRCDCRTVDSQKPETGNFFIQFGHSFDDSEKEYSGDYHGVMFAFCNTCLEQ